MPVKKDPSGRRSVQAEVEVPGTPEEVWAAIATGRGISSWFVPAEFQGGTDGHPEKVVLHFGPGTSMDSISQVTSWEPPRRWAADNSDDMGPGGPTVATEWIVEARAGGTCVVRIVHSWFTSSDKWDDQFEGHEHGWVAFFRILRLYLTHFRGQDGAQLQLMSMTPEPPAKAWEASIGALGLDSAIEGERIASRPDAPRLAGVVERLGPPEYPELLVRLDEPAQGIAHGFAITMGGTTCVSIRMYLYGDAASGTVARVEPAWRAWMDELFASAGDMGAASQEA